MSLQFFWVLVLSSVAALFMILFPHIHHFSPLFCSFIFNCPQELIYCACLPGCVLQFICRPPAVESHVCLFFLPFPGVSLTQCRPPRAAERRRCSASMWRRDTVKLYYVSTAPMTFCSLDPKVSDHNHQQSLHASSSQHC